VKFCATETSDCFNFCTKMSFVLRRGAGYDDGNLKAKFRGSGTAEGREKSQGHWTRAKAGLEARKYAHVLGAAYDPLNFGEYLLDDSGLILEGVTARDVQLWEVDFKGTKFRDVEYSALKSALACFELPDNWMKDHPDYLAFKDTLPQTDAEMQLMLQAVMAAYERRQRAGAGVQLPQSVSDKLAVPPVFTPEDRRVFRCRGKAWDLERSLTNFLSGVGLSAVVAKLWPLAARVPAVLPVWTAAAQTQAVALNVDVPGGWVVGNPITRLDDAQWNNDLGLVTTGNLPCGRHPSINRPERPTLMNELQLLKLAVTRFTTCPSVMTAAEVALMRARLLRNTRASTEEWRSWEMEVLHPNDMLANQLLGRWAQDTVYVVAGPVVEPALGVACDVPIKQIPDDLAWPDFSDEARLDRVIRYLAGLPRNDEVDEGEDEDDDPMGG
jgi:hypothetical protein